VRFDRRDGSVVLIDGDNVISYATDADVTAGTEENHIGLR
jgi:hypothetical protein